LFLLDAKTVPILLHNSIVLFYLVFG